MQNDIKIIFENGLQQLHVDLGAKQIDQCLLFIALLQKWNKTYNLTAITDPREMVVKHLLDSLALVPHLPIGNIIDVGSGAGLPGIPLAIALPDQQFALLDSDGKRTRFITQAVLELQLKNVQVIHARAEKYQPTQCYEVVLTRAFSNLTEMLHKTAQLCCNDGLFLAMKGQYPQHELDQLPIGFSAMKIVALSVPLLAEERHIVFIEKEQKNG